MNVTVEGAQVSIELVMPLDSVVGFERAPRTDAERKNAAAALDRLRDGESLFRLDAAAQCRQASADIDAPVLTQPAAPAKGDHADLEARYVFRCAQPAALASLDVALFDAFARVERVQVQAVLAKGQRKAVLRKTNRVLKLAP